MTLRQSTLGLGALALGLALTLGNRQSPAQTTAPDGGPIPQEGVTPQGRGPVHEAFAEPGYANPRPMPVIAAKPPDPIDELPPDQKPAGDNVHWIPGYWAYDEDSANYLWISGCWRAHPPGRAWMPGHWAAVQGGWQWTAGFWAAEGQADAVLLPPPPQNIDAGPSAPAPAANSVYVAGVWVNRDRRYLWRPGFWYAARPGWVWVPARYVWTPAGYVFVDGYWDYPLQTRGLLFAPVVIERRFWGRPRWYYRPSFVVYEPALVTCLFVRPDYGSYYFGDYFEARYRRLGFVAWVDFRFGRYTPDPLFAYYRWQYRGDRLWERNLHTLYVSRFSGEAPRPPRTFVQQTTIINNITVNKTVNVTNVRNVTLMAPLSRVDTSVVKLQAVSPATFARERRSVAGLRAMTIQRQQFTAQALTRGPAPLKPTDVPRAAALRLPKAATGGTGRAITRPPSAPVMPRSTVRPFPMEKSVRPNSSPRSERRPRPRVNPGSERPAHVQPRHAPQRPVKPDPRPTAKPAKPAGERPRDARPPRSAGKTPPRTKSTPSHKSGAAGNHGTKSGHGKGK